MFSTPHELIGQMVVAAVVLIDEDKKSVPMLKKYSRGMMSNHMQPREYLVLSELPKTGAGKIDYVALQKIYDERE